MTDALTIAVLAGLGLCVGSFLNVCIHRLPRRESIAWPGSRCGSCGRALAWFENVPIVSWLVLRGRCRTCGAAIAVTYPLVEAATGAIFVAGFVLYGWTPLLAVRLLFACALIVLFVIDLRHRILPNVVTLPGMAVGVASSLFLPPGWRASVIGVVGGAGVLLLIAEVYARARGEDGLGMGDVKMLGLIGAFLGWPLMLLTLVLASFMGSIVGIGVLLTNRGGMKAALPFGTFLTVAAFVSMAAGDAILSWYLAFYQ